VPALQRGQNSRAGDNKPLYLDPPQFEGFEVRHGKTLNVARKLQPQFCYEHHGATDTLDWNKSLSSWLGLKKWRESHGSNNAGSHGSNNAGSHG
jgi:hypothetical protein